jgi:hypothetical protein
MKSLLSILNMMEWLKNPTHATVPSIYKYSAQLAIIKEKYQNRRYGYRMPVRYLHACTPAEVGGSSTYLPTTVAAGSKKAAAAC